MSITYLSKETLFLSDDKKELLRKLIPILINLGISLSIIVIFFVYKCRKKFKFYKRYPIHNFIFFNTFISIVNSIFAICNMKKEKINLCCLIFLFGSCELIYGMTICFSFFISFGWLSLNFDKKILKILIGTISIGVIGTVSDILFYYLLDKKNCILFILIKEIAYIVLQTVFLIISYIKVYKRVLKRISYDKSFASIAMKTTREKMRKLFSFYILFIISTLLTIARCGYNKVFVENIVESIIFTNLSLSIFIMMLYISYLPKNLPDNYFQKIRIKLRRDREYFVKIHNMSVIKNINFILKSPNIKKEGIPLVLIHPFYKKHLIEGNYYQSQIGILEQKEKNILQRISDFSGIDEEEEDE